MLYHYFDHYHYFDRAQLTQSSICQVRWQRQREQQHHLCIISVCTKQRNPWHYFFFWFASHLIKIIQIASHLIKISQIAIDYHDFSTSSSAQIHICCCRSRCGWWATSSRQQVNNQRLARSYCWVINAIEWSTRLSDQRDWMINAAEWSSQLIIIAVEWSIQMNNLTTFSTELNEDDFFK